MMPRIPADRHDLKHASEQPRRGSRTPGRGGMELGKPLHLRSDMVAPVKRREPPPSLSISGMRAWAKFHADPLNLQHQVYHIRHDTQRPTRNTRAVPITHMNTSKFCLASSSFWSRNPPTENFGPALLIPTSNLPLGHLLLACSRAALSESGEPSDEQANTRDSASGIWRPSLGREPGRERERRRTLCVLDPRDWARAAPRPGPAPKITAMREDMVAVMNQGDGALAIDGGWKWLTSLQRLISDIYTHSSFKR